MKKLIKLFKGLPPEVRMMIAMAGLGSPLGAIYALKRWVFPNTPLVIIILYVAGAIAVICLLGFIIAKLFGRRSKKRSAKMAADLAGGAESGPVSMDVRASIKENNDKFFNQVKELRKLGISIYELPWYVVIGDSGCGKTRLINEGGLTFSTGKPEGYQLGTLNYNWWFTEDAIFIDMAGRLCNPQEDSDYREWDAFLSTVKKGRKGFPINGTVVCVSADHLLQDPPEKLEADANTMLERLRDLQSKLGVTFATYLLITKCDKVLGFMQFFDRAERDITIKNQIFGWSKPSGFEELYNPERFTEDFQALYGRLNELRLRRLNDDAEESDLGLAYSFPEEFRGMLEPLQIYARTLFPAIKNPRAIKNLIFRGMYFTSATQEGSLILKHLTERLGADAADQLPPLELYPNKRPHFIRDVFFRKVFPEQGLVFRNEGDVVKNRRRAKLLNVCSGILAVVLVGLLWWSTSSFADLIGRPRQTALDSVDPAKVNDPAEALRLASSLDADVSHLNANLMPARILSLGINTRAPIDHLKRIETNLFERRVLKRALAEVNEALRSFRLAAYKPGADLDQAAARHRDALEAYIGWYGCSGESDVPSSLTRESFAELCGVVDSADSITNQPDFEKQADAYFAAIGGAIEWHSNPARFLADGEMQPADTIRQAIGHVRSYFKRYAELDLRYSSETISEWMRIAGECKAIDQSYQRMLSAADGDYATRSQVDQLREGFLKDFGAFDGAYDATGWGLEDTPMTPITDALLQQREKWVGYENVLRDSYSACSATPDSSVESAIVALRLGSEGRPGLDQILWKSLSDAKMTDRKYSEGNYEPEKFKAIVNEVPQAFEHILVFVPGKDFEPAKLGRTDDVAFVHSQLAGVRDRVVANKAPSGQTLTEWFDLLEGYLDAADKSVDDLTFPDGFDPSGRWNRDGLTDLNANIEDIVRRGSATGLMQNIEKRLSEVGKWGLAEVSGGEDKWCDKQSSVYRIPIPECDGAVRTAPAARDDAKADRSRAKKKERGRGRRGRRGGRRRGRPAAGASTPSAGRASALRGIPVSATRGFVSGLADEWANVEGVLNDLGPGDLLSDDEGTALNISCIDKINEAGRTYFETYVGSWKNAYDEKAFPSLDRVMKNDARWESLVRRIGTNTEVEEELQESLETILGAVTFWSAYPDESGAWVVNKDDWDQMMDDAIADQWGRDSGGFVTQRQLTADFRDRDGYLDDPAALVASEFVKRWKALTRALGENAEFRTAWNRAKKSRNRDIVATSIPWRGIQTLREELHFDDEKITGKLVSFEEKAKTLLSDELTDLIAKIEKDYFGDKQAATGWPYVATSGGRVGLDTVEFAKFKKFLLDIQRAEDAFRPLEDGFDDDLSLVRSRYYTLCAKWRSFLGLDKDGRETPLLLTVRGGDPLNDPRFRGQGFVDTAHQYYRTVELNLGDLAWTSDDPDASISRGPLRRRTENEFRKTEYRAPWDWSQSRGAVMEASLIEGAAIDVQRDDNRYSPISVVLGQTSPLGICAYLQAYSHDSHDPDRRIWWTLHKFELKEGAKKDKFLAEMFEFKLDRALPEPIKPIR